MSDHPVPGSVCDTRGSTSVTELESALQTLSVTGDDDTTRILSEHPRIVLADSRLKGSPCFLYLPPGKNEFVLVDYLKSLRTVASWPVWNQPAPSPPSDPESCNYRIGMAFDKGLGMYATRALKAGELIVEERPVYAMRRQIIRGEDQTHENGIFHRNAVRGLCPKSRAALMSLKNSYPPDVHVVPGTLCTNYLQLDITPEPDVMNEFVGCFPVLSRANHACSPNANYYFSFPSFTGQFWAMRDIAKDEEITIGYCRLIAPREQRQADLRDRFFFTCTCSTCLLSGEQLAQSDERRTKLEKLLTTLETNSMPKFSSPTGALQLLEKALGWARQEKLAVHQAQILFYGSNALTVQGTSPDVVLDWMRRARELFKDTEGERSYNVRRLDDSIQFAERMLYRR